jgi:hypothetical protein
MHEDKPSVLESRKNSTCDRREISISRNQVAAAKKPAPCLTGLPSDDVPGQSFRLRIVISLPTMWRMCSNLCKSDIAPHSSLIKMFSRGETVHISDGNLNVKDSLQSGCAKCELEEHLTGGSKRLSFQKIEILRKGETK